MLDTNGHDDDDDDEELSNPTGFPESKKLKSGCDYDLISISIELPRPAAVLPPKAHSYRIHTVFISDIHSTHWVL